MVAGRGGAARSRILLLASVILSGWTTEALTSIEIPYEGALADVVRESDWIVLAAPVRGELISRADPLALTRRWEVRELVWSRIDAERPEPGAVIDVEAAHADLRGDARQFERDGMRKSLLVARYSGPVLAMAAPRILFLRRGASGWQYVMEAAEESPEARDAILAALASQVQAIRIREIDFGRGLGGQFVLEPPAGESMAWPEELRFESAHAIEVTADTLEMSGAIVNRTGHPVVLYLGVMRAGSPLLLAPRTGGSFDLRPRGSGDEPLAPPAPPPYRVEIPPHARVRVVGQVALDAYRWSGTPRVEVEWLLNALKNDGPRGTLSVTLPLAR